MTGLDGSAEVASVRARLVSLLGLDPAKPSGEAHVVQSAYVGHRGSGMRVVRIGPHAPPCPTDGFLLHAARARADAIVTTGRILRDELGLHYDLGAHLGLHGSMVAYREAGGRAEPPRLFVLSRGGLPLDHPALHGYAKATVVVPTEAVEPLAADVESAGLTLLRLDGGLASLLDRLAPLGTVLVEAGPSAVAPALAGRGAFDELVLTVCESPTLDAAADAGPLAGAEHLDELYGPPRSCVRFEEAGGRFRVERYLRR